MQKRLLLLLPDKLFVNTETGLRSAEMDNHLGGDLVRRNWIIKLALLCIEYDVRQLHILNLEDSNGGYGDYDNIGKYVSLEEGYTHLKSSSKGRATLKKMNLGKYVFDEKKTTKFRESLPANVTGIVLKRKFPKVENEEFYYEYMYSVWLLCIKEEVQGEGPHRQRQDTAPLEDHRSLNRQLQGYRCRRQG